MLQVLPAELSVLGVLDLEQRYPLSSVGLVKGGPRCRCQSGDTSSWLLCRGGALEEGL